MAEQNRSEILNVTNQTIFTAASCTGLSPSKFVQIITYAVLMTFSLLGNVLVVAVFYRNKTLRTAVHYFIMNMAISDLIISVITLPWWISDAYHDGLWLVDGVLGTVLCKLVRISWGLSYLVSILSMVAIAADRFHAVLFPMKSALFSRNKCRLVIAAIWVASVASWAHYLYGAKLVTSDTGLHCDVQWEPPSHTIEVIFINWMLLFCLSCVSAIIITVLYSSIIIFLYRQKNNIHLANQVIKTRAKENLQVTFMLVIIVLAFYEAWIPITVVNFISYLEPNSRLPCFLSWLTRSISPLLYLLVNPVVYYVFIANYRQGFRELLLCSWPCNNKCNYSSQPSDSRQGQNNNNNAEQVNNDMANIELQEQ